jgi:hypothetical protein
VGEGVLLESRMDAQGSPGGTGSSALGCLAAICGRFWLVLAGLPFARSDVPSEQRGPDNARGSQAVGGNA